MEICLLDTVDIPGTASFAERWIASARSDIGPAIDRDSCMNGVRAIIAAGSGDALVLVQSGGIVGLLCVEYGAPGYSTERIARERYFYVDPEHRGRWTLRLRAAAEELAAKNGCSHIVYTVSEQAGGDVERIESYLIRTGCKPLERTYIKEL